MLEEDASTIACPPDDDEMDDPIENIDARFVPDPDVESRCSTDPDEELSFHNCSAIGEIACVRSITMSTSCCPYSCENGVRDLRF